ncbi:hypothetical protein FJZ19_00275 [Candidatus Pacearchaeota archaeon]|nr:hypothetical protein [Candidatus Pacearchaeota archaeon]
MNEIEKTKIKRVLSRLYFISSDLEAIDKIKIEDAETANLASEIRERVEKMKEMLIDKHEQSPG